MNSTKIAISLPLDTARMVERLRKESGESRSAFIRKALERIFEERQKARDIQAYIEGYRRMPETSEDRVVPESVVMESLAKEPWD